MEPIGREGVSVSVTILNSRPTGEGVSHPSPTRRSVIFPWMAGVLLLGLVSCRKPAQAPHTAADLSYLPANVLFVGYADTVRLKESSLYHAWESRPPAGRSRLAEVKTFLRRLEIDPDKDLEGVMVACQAGPSQGAWMTLLRGRFDLERVRKGLEEPSARMSVQAYGKWSIYNLVLVPELGDLSIALVDSSAIALGKAETLQRILDARDHPETSLARSPLMKQLMPALEPRAQVWLLVDGRAVWQSLGEHPGALPDSTSPPGLGNLSSIVSASLSASLSEGMTLHLEIGSDSPKHAQSLADALKGVLGFAQLGGGAKEPDLAQLVEAIHVEGAGQRIFVRADLPAELAMRLGARLEAASTR